MTKSQTSPVPAAVYLVADHLDAMLAAGEDLLRLRRTDGPAYGDVRVRAADDRSFADAVRTLEITIAARCLQGRARAAEVRAVDPRYKALIDLFIGGTAVLEDAVADLGDSTGTDFHAGCDSVSYLRSRGVIAVDAPGLQCFADVCISEDFLLAARIRLGDLMDLCATFLDRLEDHYELFVDSGLQDHNDSDDDVLVAAGDEADADQDPETDSKQVPAALIAQAGGDNTADRTLAP